MDFQFVKADQEFYLMVGKTAAGEGLTPKEDNTTYNFHISECNLYVQVGQLNVSLYNELRIRWEKEDIKYFFRRFDMLEENIGKGKKRLNSNALWSDSINPLRIYFFLVASAAYSPGDYKKNPVIKQISATF